MLLENPWCIFCGGTEQATTVDHIPPIIVFTGKDRPKGLEFSACSQCNQGTRNLDQVLGLFSRFHSFEEGESRYKADIEKIIKAIANNKPDVFAELSNFQPSGDGAIISVGPLMRKSLCEIGAKIGLAFHYEMTQQIVPKEGGVLTVPISNFEAMQEGLPPYIASFFPHEQTLKAGTKNVHDQFTYASQYDAANKLGAHWVTFRQSVGLQIFVAEDLKKLNVDYADKFIQPGWLKKK